MSSGTIRQACDYYVTEETWLSFCSVNHNYIKAPIRTWKEIKSGIIWIGDGEITVKEWFVDLKEERRQNAWKTFWTT